MTVTVSEIKDGNLFLDYLELSCEDYVIVGRNQNGTEWNGTKHERANESPIIESAINDVNFITFFAPTKVEGFTISPPPPPSHLYTESQSVLCPFGE